MNSIFIVTEIEPIAHPSEKDWLALEFLDSVRLARTSHIVDSVGWSTEYGPKRLRQYHRAGWVMKFPQYLEFSGSPEDIYALTTLGAKHLRNARGIKTSPTQDQKNRKLLDEQGKLPLPAHHLHTLGIAEVTRRFHVGCRAMNGAVNFIDQPAFTTMLPPTTRALPNPWSWGVQAHPNHFWKTGIALDRAFALDLAYRGQCSHLFFEFYRNMPLYRTNLINQRSVILKLLCIARTDQCKSRKNSLLHTPLWV